MTTNQRRTPARVPAPTTTGPSRRPLLKDLRVDTPAQRERLARLLAPGAADRLGEQPARFNSAL
ncbi:hypothetical protein ABT160_05960 [Streptomyces sp. NPDC001941]|uniref:hypothetical protein n=1 Tax=Streptomyces sp. NPDC001941 TaxID=3154659 RepID=UPI003328D2A9